MPSINYGYNLYVHQRTENIKSFWIELFWYYFPSFIWIAIIIVVQFRIQYCLDNLAKRLPNLEV